MDMSKRGFTLVEVLCVIAIIAVLAMILFPVFAHAREKARQTACLNNQKQVALAFTIWAQDHDESFPGGENWAAALTLPPKSSLICLTQGRARAGGNSYGYNTYVADSTLGEFDQPQTTVLTTDCVPSNAERLLRTGADYDARHNGIVSYINNSALNRMTIHGTGTGITVKLRDHVYKLPAPATWNRPAKLQAWSSIKTPGDVTMINPNFNWH